MINGLSWRENKPNLHGFFMIWPVCDRSGSGGPENAISKAGPPMRRSRRRGRGGPAVSPEERRSRGRQMGFRRRAACSRPAIALRPQAERGPRAPPGQGRLAGCHEVSRPCHPLDRGSPPLAPNGRPAARQPAGSGDPRRTQVREGRSRGVRRAGPGVSRNVGAVLLPLPALPINPLFMPYNDRNRSLSALIDGRKGGKHLALHADSTGLSESIRKGQYYICRVGATHRIILEIGGLHPPHEELLG